MKQILTSPFTWLIALVILAVYIYFKQKNVHMNTLPMESVTPIDDLRNPRPNLYTDAGIVVPGFNSPPISQR